MRNPEAQFVSDNIPNLHSSTEVDAVVDYLKSNGESIPNEPSSKVASYLGFLAEEEYVNDGALTGDKESIERQAQAGVVVAEDIPDAYFESQLQLLKDRGHGSSTLTDTLKREMTIQVQKDQKISLTRWLRYLSAGDASYPDWFKFYVSESVKKLAPHTGSTIAFKKRTKTTVGPYPELNPEALSYVFESIKTDIDISEGKTHSNFGKLYSEAFERIKPASPEQRKITEGEWVRYEQIDEEHEPHFEVAPDGEFVDTESEVTNPTALKLARSLQGHGTGWCTAGESTAANQLSSGDFYVYYSKSADGKNTIPRLAIRTELGVVAEVRGIEDKQAVESILIPTVGEKLKQLPGGDEYEKRVSDMQRLTDIYTRVSRDPEVHLDAEELKFIYQIDDKIMSFAPDYDDEADPRIREILNQRNLIDDMAVILDCSSEEVPLELSKTSQRVEILFDNIDAFNMLSDEVARAIIELSFEHGFRGQIESYLVHHILVNLNKFSGLSQYVYDSVHEVGDSYYVSTVPGSLGSFDGLSYKTADELCRAGYGKDVFSNLKSFDVDSFGPETARLLINNGNVDYLAGNIQMFRGLGPEEVNALLDNGYTLPEDIAELVFEDIDQNLMAELVGNDDFDLDDGTLNELEDFFTSEEDFKDF